MTRPEYGHGACGGTRSASGTAPCGRTSPGETDPCAAGVTATLCGACAPGYCLNTWVSPGGGFTRPGYYRDLTGRIYLRGLVDLYNTDYYREETHGPIFILPAGYRPAHELIFATLDNDNNRPTTVRVDVDTAGVVQMYSDYNQSCNEDPNLKRQAECGQYLSLDNISFVPSE